MNTNLGWRAAFVTGLVLCGTSGVHAQAAGGQQQQSPQQQQRGAKQPAAEPGPGPLDESTTQRNYAQGETPTPPPGQQIQNPLDNPEISTGVGVGSDIAYATSGVVELGGVLALTHQSETTTFRIAPSLGYFVADNLELTLFPELSILSVDGETDFRIGLMLEPSYHVPFSDRFFGFAGIGIGFGYAEDPGFDFVLRPKIGVDIMIGRSGILKPAAFLDIGTNDGLTAGGVEAGFTVML